MFTYIVVSIADCIEKLKWELGNFDLPQFLSDLNDFLMSSSFVWMTLIFLIWAGFRTFSIIRKGASEGMTSAVDLILGTIMWPIKRIGQMKELNSSKPGDDAPLPAQEPQEATEEPEKENSEPDSDDVDIPELIDLEPKPEVK